VSTVLAAVDNVLLLHRPVALESPTSRSSPNEPILPIPWFVSPLLLRRHLKP